MLICLNTECDKIAKIKFCGRSCAATYNNKIFPKRKTIRNCSYKNCSNRTNNYKTRLCSEHLYSKIKFLTVGEYQNRDSVKNKNPSWKNTHVRMFNRSWNKDMTTLPCKNCNYNKHVELAHIKPITSFPMTATLGEINNKTNVVQLCRNCHWEFDNGLLELACREGFEPPT